MKRDLSDPMSQYASAPNRKISTGTEIKEVTVHNQVCQYLKLQYPNVMFMSDFGAGLRMGFGAAQLQRKQKSNHSYPDLIIFAQRGGYGALMIEIKKNRDVLYRKCTNIMLANEHHYTQEKTHEQLRANGYLALFGCGFDECKQIIDEYFNN